MFKDKEIVTLLEKIDTKLNGILTLMKNKKIKSIIKEKRDE